MALEPQPLGRSAVAYLNGTALFDETTHNPDTPAQIATWLALSTTNVMGDIFDNEDGLTPEYADISTRRRVSDGISARKPVLREGEVSFDMLWSVNAPAGEDDLLFVQQIIDASNANSRLGMFFSDYAFDDPNLTTGEIYQGLIGNWYVTFTKQEAIRDVQKASVVCVAESFSKWFKSDPAP